MAGRPSLRIGQHGKITRKYLGGGIWLAQCRFRDTDGVTRKVQRLGPSDEHDKYGKLAADALIEALADRRPPAGPDSISLETLVMTLVDQHIERLAEDGRSARTLDTYRYGATKLFNFMAGVKVGEASPARLDAALRSMRTTHGPTMARQARTLLRGALQLAVLNNVLGANPVHDVQSIKSKAQPKGAQALAADQLRDLLAKLRASKTCRQRDLTDPITLLIATGLRRSELLALRWSDFDAEAGTISVCGKVIRQKAKGLIRVDETKTAAGRRVIPLPAFAITALTERRNLPYLGQQSVIFPSTNGTLRDPDNFAGQWRKTRDELGVPDISSHSFRKTVATLIDDAGLSARIGADHLGHAKVSMTQDRYMSRGRVHNQVAELLDEAVKCNSGPL
ncbi:integrase [Mycobacterium sherrisii]|uniref:Integrase n=1 Tax=Mycobacterium sherrisii TaxID=243061 RepID=A0A1E3T6Z5_9MYCO|nr:site-specific integrase [Mycobacterium sherrisii]ODR10130.1 integrase [Mycobacterium sherrisii]